MFTPTTKVRLTGSGSTAVEYSTADPEIKGSKMRFLRNNIAPAYSEISSRLLVRGTNT